MQRLGAALVPDFLFSESTFTPLVAGSGGGGNSGQLAAALSATGQPQQLAQVVSLLMQRWAPPQMPQNGQHCSGASLSFPWSAAITVKPQNMFTREPFFDCSYAAHHAKRVEVIAATDDQLQFELDTTAAEGRQVMLQNPAGASAMKVCWTCPRECKLCWSAVSSLRHK